MNKECMWKIFAWKIIKDLGEDIKIVLRELGCEDMNLTEVAEDRLSFHITTQN